MGQQLNLYSKFNLIKVDKNENIGKYTSIELYKLNPKLCDLQKHKHKAERTFVAKNADEVFVGVTG